MSESYYVLHRRFQCKGDGCKNVDSTNPNRKTNYSFSLFTDEAFHKLPKDVQLLAPMLPMTRNHSGLYGTRACLPFFWRWHGVFGGNGITLKRSWFEQHCCCYPGSCNCYSTFPSPLHMNMLLSYRSHGILLPPVAIFQGISPHKCLSFWWLFVGAVRQQVTPHGKRCRRHTNENI
jgi:hypothetical protein